jgi:hypothetical protein
MIEMSTVQQPQLAGDSTSAGLSGAEHQSADPRVDQRADTHGAGFYGDIQGRAGQPVVAQTGRGITDCGNFRVAGGVVGADGAVEAGTDQLTVTTGTSPTSAARCA